MKILLEPTIHVLNDLHFCQHPDYELPGHDNEFDKLIAHAGKGCYDSYGKDGRSVSAHIASLLDSHHGSVFEHATISLFITGISRGLSHELVRHRHFAFSQRSTRYTNEEDAAIVLDPYFAKLDLHEKDCGHGNCNKCDTYWTFVNGCEDAIDRYTRTVANLLEEDSIAEMTKIAKRKWARGKARQLLPHALETRMTMTGNIRAWRWLIENRSQFDAEEEIRRLAFMIWEKLIEVVPSCFSDFKEEFKTGERYPQLVPKISKI